MKILNNIIHGPPSTTVPNISVQQYVLDNLRTNLDHFLQVDIESGKSFTRRDILEASVTLAAILKTYGIVYEDRISVASENHPNILIVMCAIFNIGAIYAPMNPAYKEREYRHMLEIIKPRVIFVSQQTDILLAKIASTLNWTMKLIELDDKALSKNVPTLKELLEKHKSIVDPYTFVSAPIGDSSKEIAAIFSSSGTTGYPKAVALSHRNILSFTLNSSGERYLDILPNDRFLLFLPMFHGYGFGITLKTIGFGATVYIMRSFKMETFLQSIEKYKISHLPVVPPVLILLAKYPIVSNYDFSSLKYLLCGAAALPKYVADIVKRRMKIKHIRNIYGMTELSIMTHMSDTTLDDDNVGLLLPGFLCKIVNSETRETLCAGQVGEVCFKGDQVMLGYLNNSEITAETIDKDKWLYTGDLGYFNDNGILYITGRLKELIKYKGFQVSPSEIETILQSYAGVKDAAVVGKQDEINGEIPMALVVKQPGSNVTAKEIIDFANRNLSPQKWLRGGLKFVETIPKTPSGKILRRELLTTISKL